MTDKTTSHDELLGGQVLCRYLGTGRKEIDRERDAADVAAGATLSTLADNSSPTQRAAGRLLSVSAGGILNANVTGELLKAEQWR